MYFMHKLTVMRCVYVLEAENATMIMIMMMMMMMIIIIIII